MALFKSEAERRAERNLKIKQSVRMIQKGVQHGEKILEDFKAKAVRARQLGDTGQLATLRAAMKRAINLKRAQERALLSIESALLMKDQAESVGAFAAAMGEVSKAVGAAFGQIDMTRGIREFEATKAKSEFLQDQMDTFLEAVAGADSEPAGGDAVSDAELDAFIDDAAATAEEGLVDERVRAGLDRVRKEMSK